jgi:1-acyl-sn-glycerol-3-phosphate acyltransferase
MNIPLSLRDAAAWIVGKLIVGFASLLTGVQARWATAPQALPTLYFANHTSHGDFVLVWAALPPDLRAVTRPVAGADYWTASALRRFVGRDVVRALMIRRDASTPGDDPVQAMVDALAGGDSLIMFPEGTRNVGDEIMLPLKSGLFHIARQREDVRLVPVWIENLKRVLPKGMLVPVPLACSVAFGEPIRLGEGEDKAAFIARARAAMLALQPDAQRAAQDVADAASAAEAASKASHAPTAEKEGRA